MRFHRFRFVLVVVVSFSVGWASQVYAETKSSIVDFRDPDRRACTRVYSGISNLPIANGSLFTSVRSLTENCGSFVTRPVGHLQVDWQIMKWDGTQWAFCDALWASVKNDIANYELSISAEPLRRCGNGYYGNIGYASVWNGFNRWVGGEVWSGDYWLST